MTKTREKKIVHIGIKEEEMELAMADFARADARLQKINATMDIEMTKIREKYQNEIVELGEVKDKAFDILQAFSLENKASLFSKKKSLDTLHGVIGFRTGTPKLKILKGFTWASVTNLLREFLPDYVRNVVEPAKDRLLADREDENVSSMFNKVGLTVIQEETFFVEPKKEE